MAAVFTTFASLLSQGDHVISANALFGSTHRLLTDVFPKWGVESDFLKPKDLENVEAYIRPATKLVYIETPSNPGLQLIDVERLSEVCKRNNILLVVDNCFATPLIQQPLKNGADVVIHSATKYLDGQGRTLGGAIISSVEIIERIKGFARHAGPALSPFNAWVLSKSIETLDVRMERHCSNALEVARWLESNTDVDKVYYPHLPSHPQYKLARKQMKWGGGIVTCELKGGMERVGRFMDQLELFTITANLGDTRSIVTHPASSTHSKLTAVQRSEMGISDRLLRFSIGLESVRDLKDDILSALDHS